MAILFADSLSQTVDAINDAFFFGRIISNAENNKTARWLASRQGALFSYANLYAPTDRDRQEGLQLFTGERINSRAGAAHILGEDANRALLLLNSPLKSAQQAIQRAGVQIIESLRGLRQRPSDSPWNGMFCCATCTPALWRNLAAGGFENGEEYITIGLRNLRSLRDGKGRWKVFPFYWTLLALTDIASSQAIQVAAARDELQYAAPVCERLVKRPTQEGKYAQRRHALMEKVLISC